MPLANPFFDCSADNCTIVVAGCGGNNCILEFPVIDVGEGGVGGGKDDVPPLLFGYTPLPGDAIVMIVLLGEGVARNDPGREAGETA